jgi:hypothetical protein
MFGGSEGRELLQHRRSQLQADCQTEPEDAEGAIVTKESFEYEMWKANTFAYLGERACYWEGYQRGLRRAYYGELFGSQEEHELWMGFAGDRKANEFQRERGRGYLDGLAARLAPAPPRAG